MQKPNRNTFIDTVRSFGIIYIIGVVHPLFWKGYTLDPILKSFALIEMPFIFFAMGASATISHTRHSGFEGLISRLKRLILPYLAYMAVVIFAEKLYNFLILKDVGKLSLSEIAASFSWSYPTTNLPYVRLHLWFIPVALLFALVGTPVYKAVLSFARTPTVQKAALSIIFLGIPFVAENSGPPAVAQLFFYMPWFLAGAMLIDKPEQVFSRSFVVLCSFAGMGLFCIAISLGVSRDMQVHKFAPDRYFMWYTLSIVPIILFVMKRSEAKLPLCVRNEISWWANESYLAYLWQSFSYLLISFAMIKLNLHVTDIFSTLCVGLSALLITRLIVTGIRLLIKFSNKAYGVRYTNP